MITYKIKRKRLCRYEEENDDKMRPYAYILVSKSGTYILYTPLMTFIDGYDPYTGHKISPFITPDILKSSFRKFYYNHSQNLKNPKVFNGTFGQQKKGMLVFIASDAKELKDKIDPLKIKDVLGRIESSVDVSKSYKEEFDIYSDDDISIEEISQKSGFISDVSFLRSAREDISIRSTSPVKETEVELDFNHPEFKNTAKAELVEFPYERRYEYISIDWKQTQKKITKSRDYCGADSCLIF